MEEKIVGESRIGSVSVNKDFIILSIGNASISVPKEDFAELKKMIDESFEIFKR